MGAQDSTPQLSSGDVLSQVLLCWVRSTPPHCSLSPNVLREVCSYMHSPHRLTCVSAGKLWQFDSERWEVLSPMNSPLDFYFEFTTFVGQNKLFVWGLVHRNKQMWRKRTEMYVIQDGVVTKMPHSLVKRIYPGIVYYQPLDCVYVFGGSMEVKKRLVESLRSGETLALQRPAWSALPLMHQGRSDFSPCLYKSLVFLVGGYGNNSAETFDPCTMKFELLSGITLPEFGPAVSVITALGELIVVSQNWMSRWNLRSKGSGECRQKSKNSCFALRCRPMLVSNRLYYLRRNVLTSVALDTLTPQFSLLELTA